MPSTCGQGRVCTNANTSCCAWICVFSQIERSVQKLQNLSGLPRLTLMAYGFVQVIGSGIPEAIIKIAAAWTPAANSPNKMLHKMKDLSQPLSGGRVAVRVISGRFIRSQDGMEMSRYC